MAKQDVAPLSPSEEEKLRASVAALATVEDDYSLQWSNHPLARLLATLDAVRAERDQLIELAKDACLASAHAGLHFPALNHLIAELTGEPFDTVTTRIDEDRLGRLARTQGAVPEPKDRAEPGLRAALERLVKAGESINSGSLTWPKFSVALKEARAALGASDE